MAVPSSRGDLDKAAAFSQRLDDEVQLWFKTPPESSHTSKFPHRLDVLFKLSGMMSKVAQIDKTEL